MKILIVEDDTEVAQYVEEVIMNTAGLESAEVTAAGDGSQARGALQSGRFDLILLDIKLPVDDGLTLLGFIREKNPSLPVVVISGYLDAGKLAALRGLGVHSALFKPVTPESIHKAITSALNIGAGAEERG